MLERATRPAEGRASLLLEADSGQPRLRRDVRGAPHAWRPSGGGARRTVACPRVSAVGAPRVHRI